MPTYQNRWRWVVSCALIVVLAAGCHQQGGIEPEPLAPLDFDQTGTDMLPPDDSSFPTPEPEDTFPDDTFPDEPDTGLFEPEPFEETFEEPPDDIILVPTQDFFQFPTATPMMVPTDDPFAGLPVVPTPDPFAAIAQLPTDPPTDPFFQEQDLFAEEAIDPVFMTATAIIAGATATEAFYLTQTAVSQGFGIPTEEPVFFPTETPFTVAPQPGADCVHQVQAGENLFRISLRYGVDVFELARYNSLPNMNLIVVGQSITIPGCGTTGQVPSQPGIPSTGTGVCGPLYTVQQGDTLFKISLRCGVPVMSIAAANGISNINLILINQQLTIPPG